jgi:cyclopropane-fatty-acyl-phospholipid synthase
MKSINAPTVETFSLLSGGGDEQFDFLRPYVRTAGLFGLGEACLKGEIPVENIERLIVKLSETKGVLPGKWQPLTLLSYLQHLFLNPQKGAGAFLVGKRHYDLGNDLFTAMLDRSMSYTCAYWKGSSSLEEAQVMKLDRICSKLKLRPGLRVLDIGCGWGNFAYHAAKNFGVSVVGLTVSREQATFARDRCRDLPVEILLQDYREFRGEVDRVVSIEMIEAVGRRNLPAYFQLIHDCLPRDGLAFIQAISAENFNSYSHPALDQFLVWLVKHIFPNGYLPTHRELIEPGRSLFVIEEVENISDDYEKTLRAWRENFEHHWPTLSNKYGEQFRRAWLYYLGGSIAMFQLRMANVFQVLFSKTRRQR